MKSLSIIALAATTTAFVLPNEQVSFLSHVPKQGSHDLDDAWSSFKQQGGEALNKAEHAFDRAAQRAEDAFDSFASSADDTFDEVLSNVHEEGARLREKIQNAWYETQGWAESVHDKAVDEFDALDESINHPPHHHPPHHKPNKTVYELLNEYPHSTKFAKLVNKFPEAVKALNGSSANWTVFVPVDSAFEHIPHDHKPSDKFLESVLEYHVSEDFYPAGRILVSRTIPTFLKPEALGNQSQRLSTDIGLRGLTVNFYARVIRANIFGTNGVIHGLASIILPPPKAVKIVSLLPGEFSTLELALLKTGLGKALNDTSAHVGGTLFAPSNFAFKKLGPRINAFLFSSYGEKYLEGLLKYHVVANATLYSDAFYKGKAEAEGIPKGHFHVDLPTLLKDHSLSIDIGRFGRLIDIRINGYSHASAADIPAEDGVIHVLSSVLIPPKKLASGEVDEWKGEGELTVEDLKERLEPFVEHKAAGFWEDL